MNQTGSCWMMGLVITAVVIGGLAGCETGHARYTPTKGEARTALETALTAWRDGKSFGTIDATPAVHVADTAWQAGEQIEAFEIGEEEDSGDGTKQFPVKLTKKKAKTAQQMRYVVHGRDPIWVFSEPDYKRMIDMGNGENVKQKNPRGPSGKR